jgi:hypothetical protein
MSDAYDCSPFGCRALIFHRAPTGKGAAQMSDSDFAQRHKELTQERERVDSS